jgi:DNA invertase Pin-like site-specific DNA recombinase
MEDARCGRFRVLGVWALDRIGRDMLATVRSVLELERLGVQIVSMREPWLDTGGPVKNLLLAIFAWVAEQERARIGERTRAALAAARARGVRLGGPPLDAAKVAAALDACQRGMSFRAAAKRYGISDRALRKRARGFIR